MNKRGFLEELRALWKEILNDPMKIIYIAAFLIVVWLIGSCLGVLLAVINVIIYFIVHMFFI